MSPYRKYDPRRHAFQVKVCGYLIQKEGNVVCTLAPHHSTTNSAANHAAVVVSEIGTIYAFIKTPNGDVQVWLLVEEAQG